MKKHGVLWWLFIGWYWVPLKWLFKKIFEGLFNGSAPKNITFEVAGMSYYPDSVNALIKELRKSTPPEKRWSGYTDKAILRIGDYRRHYEIPYQEHIEGCELVREPQNKHDPNAVKVIINNLHVGYVPADIAKQVGEMIRRKPTITWIITGGRYKQLDSDTNEVLTMSANYYIKIIIN